MNQLLKKHRQKCQKQVRTLFPTASSETINFAGSDYLNLAAHPYIKEQGIAYSIKWGSGILPTRQIPSYEAALKKTEENFAKFLGHETVTFYETDPHLLSHLTHLNDKPITFTNSISRQTGIATSPSKSKDLILAVDDSLTFSLFGKHGFGLMAENEEIDILLGSFSKNFGSYISYIACSKQLKSQLFDKIPTLHKEQYISPLYLGMIDATIKLIPSLNAERKRHHNLCKLLKNTLKKTLYAAEETKAPFATLSFSNNLEMKNLQLHLADNSFITSATNLALTLFPTLQITEKEITSLYLSLTTYKELPKHEAL